MKDVKYYAFSMETTNETDGFQDVVEFDENVSDSDIDKYFLEWQNEKNNDLTEDESVVGVSKVEIPKKDALMLGVDITY